MRIFGFEASTRSEQIPVFTARSISPVPKVRAGADATDVLRMGGILIDDRVESSDDRAVTAAPIVDLDEAEVPTVVAGRTELIALYSCTERAMRATRTNQ